MNDRGAHPGGQRILAWLDGELPPAEAEQVRRHCEECEPCGSERKALAAVGEALADQPASDPIRPVWPVIRDRLGTPDRPVLKPAFGVAAAAAVLAGVALGILVGSAAIRGPEARGSYMWSSIGSSLAEDGGGTLSGAYAGLSIAERETER